MATHSLNAVLGQQEDRMASILATHSYHTLLTSVSLFCHMGRVRALKNIRRVKEAQALCTQLTLNKRQLLHWREALRP